MYASPGTSPKHHFRAAATMVENSLNGLAQLQTVISRSENTSAGLIFHRIKSAEVGPGVFGGLPLW